MKTKILFPLVILLFGIAPAFAVNHVINFGGALGNVYSPNTLTVDIGDTITWEGTFSSHPLEAVTRPSGAAAFGSGSGTSFSYPVTVAGNYTYHCTIHFGSGMTGSFTANDTTGTGIRKAEAVDVRIYPVVTSDVVNVALSNHNGNKYSIEVVNVDGRVMSAPVPVANNFTQINFSTLSPGVYFLLVRDESGIAATRKILRQ